MPQIKAALIYTGDQRPENLFLRNRFYFSGIIWTL